MRAPDPHFPSVHLRPPLHWVNDPNGLVFHDGAYHVFFQYNPDSARHANMHWGHWRSRDLVRWELLPVALAPTPGGPDADGVWSGNAVSVGGEMVAFYAARQDERWWQPVAAAISADGVAFTKVDELPVAVPPPGATMFRDPYVWRDAGRWRMLVGAALEDGRAAAIQYVSDDLRTWTCLGPYLALPPMPLVDDRDTEEGWECVQYADLGGGRAALVFSAWDPVTGASATGIHVGRDHGTTFVPEALQPFDHGPDAYAPALLRAPDGRWLAWAWVWEARDEERVGASGEWIDEVGWAGMLSLPRELALTPDGIRQTVAREVDQLRIRSRIDCTRTVTAGSSAPLGDVSRCLDLRLRLERSTDGRAASGVRLVTSYDGGEHLDLLLDPATGDLVVDRSAASQDARAKRGAWRIPLGVPAAAAVELRAIVDHSVIEVFAGTGEVLTMRFYPVSGAPWRLEAFVAGVGQTGLAVRAWDLAPLVIREAQVEQRIYA